MKNLQIGEGSDAGSNDHTPAQKFSKIENEKENEEPWIRVAQKALEHPQKRKIPYIIEHIDQILQPLGFSCEEKSQKLPPYRAVSNRPIKKKVHQ